ncbi:MAG: hypothetical protein GXO79_01800 [Chlorobi bacterium]|nr:hypothetical protein [Chlorobiota bacterium]
MKNKIVNFLFKKTLIFLGLLVCSHIIFAQIPSGYYDSANGLTGSALKQELHNIITTGHTKLSYTPGVWNAYATTDVKPSPNNTIIWDMYSDIPSGTPSYTYTLSTDQCGTYSGEGGCYNREHSFPKSWWGAADNTANPQYTDLNHLFATDGYVNSKRSNYPFGQVTSPTFTSTNGSKLGPNTYPGGYTGTVFEPIDDYKGDFARGYFYMATRYKDEIPGWVSTYGATTDIDIVFDAAGEFNTWYLNMLLEWNTNDPVSQKELDRNQAVYNAQGNANPYIDHPEYIDCIWAANCGGSPTISNIAHSPTNPTSSDAVSVTANISDDGSVSSATLYWGTDGSTFPNSISMTVGTPPAYSSSSNIPSQSSGTTVYYKITAVDDASNSTTSSANNYTIPKAEPTNFPTSFNSGAVSSSSIDLSWTDASSGVVPDNYLIKSSTVSYNDITSPVDGTSESDATLVKNISQGTQTASFTGLSASTTYYFKIFSYTNSGTNINYKTDATIPTASGTTDAVSPSSTETFVNYPETGSSYNSGTFTGVDGSTWTYTSCRGDQQITAETPCLAKGKTPAASVESGSIAGGCGTLSFDYKMAFSTGVNIDVYVNNVLKGNITSSTAGVQNSGSITVNETGSFTIKFVQNNTGSGQISIDNVTWTSYSVSCNAPTTQASSLVLSNITKDSITVNCTRGNGDGVIIKMNTSNSFTNPVDGTDPSANSTYGSGEQVIYNSSGNSVTVIGLTGNTNYYFEAFEKNCSGSSIKFITNNPPKAFALTPNATSGGSSGSIAFQGFEGSGSDNWGYTGGTINLTSAKTGSNGAQLANSSSIIFNETSISGYTSVKVKIADASSGGIENADALEIYVALNSAAFSATPDITIQESNPTDAVYNESWNFTASGIATTTAGTPATFTGSGATGYASVEITIPDGNSSLALKIIGATNKTTEYFHIDDVEITGLSSSYSTTNTDYFRTCVSGNYNSASTWQSSNDNTNWYASSLVPDINATNIIISENTSITHSSDITLNNLEIKTGSNLSFSADNLTLTVQGNIVANGNLDLSRAGSLLKLNGAALQTLSGTGTVSLYNLEVDNTNNVTFQNDVTVSNLLTITNGVINSSSNTITIENASTTAITGFSSTKYINGILKRAVNATGSYEFPVGSSSNYEYAKIDLNSSNGISYLTASFSTSITGSAPSLTLNSVNINSLLDAGIWTITPDAVSSVNYDVTIVSRGHTNGGISSDYHTILKRDNSTAAWGLYGSFNVADQSGSGTNPITLKRTGITSFSDFGGGTGNAPLPIELLSFNVKKVNNSVKIEWETASEINNDFFTILRSGDGLKFESILDVPGKGNSNTIMYYFAFDNFPLEGISYYQLKQFDFDGTSSMSKILSLNNNIKDLKLTLNNFSNTENGIYGNILNPEFAILSLFIYDGSGKIIEMKNLGKSNFTKLSISTKNYKSGIYYLIINNGHSKISKKFVVWQ